MEDIYALSQCGVCTYLLVGKTHALVLDTGCGLADPMPQIRELTDKPLYVVNSHGHYDHTAGNHYFGGQVYIHEADKAVHDNHNSPASRKIAVDSMKQLQKLLFFLRIIPKHFHEASYINASLFTDFAYIKEGDQFDLGGMTAHVVEIPGHTPGSIGLLVPEKKLFLASDGINSGTWLFLPESVKLEIYRDSLYKADKLGFAHLLTGHSSALIPKAVLKEYIAVAENPDFEGGKVQKENAFAPGVEPRVCRAKGSKSKAAIMISRDKL